MPDEPPVMPEDAGGWLLASVEEDACAPLDVVMDVAGTEELLPGSGLEDESWLLPLPGEEVPPVELPEEEPPAEEELPATFPLDVPDAVPAPDELDVLPPGSPVDPVHAPASAIMVTAAHRCILLMAPLPSCGLTGTAWWSHPTLRASATAPRAFPHMKPVRFCIKRVGHPSGWHTRCSRSR